MLVMIPRLLSRRPIAVPTAAKTFGPARLGFPPDEILIMIVIRGVEVPVCSVLIPLEKSNALRAWNERRRYLAPMVFACFGLASFLSTAAQDAPAVILGNLSDGTLPPPATKPALPDFEIRESFEARLSDRNISIHRVKNPGLPDPVPVKESLFAAREVGAWRNSAQFLEWRARREKTTDLWLSASVVEHRATLLRWHHDGNEFLAWSLRTIEPNPSILVYEISSDFMDDHRHRLCESDGGSSNGPRFVYRR